VPCNGIILNVKHFFIDAHRRVASRRRVHIRIMLTSVSDVAIVNELIFICWLCDFHFVLCCWCLDGVDAHRMLCMFSRCAGNDIAIRVAVLLRSQTTVGSCHCFSTPLYSTLCLYVCVSITTSTSIVSTTFSHFEGPSCPAFNEQVTNGANGCC